MSEIYKYDLQDLFGKEGVSYQATIELPQNAWVFHGAVQRGRWCIWAEVDPGAVTERRTFAVVMTGSSVDSLTMKHIATELIEPFVLHLYEVRG